MPHHLRHDRAILDALDTMDGVPFAGEVWRITAKGRDAARGSTTGGRWSQNGGFEVLYTSLEMNGALAEIGYRLSLEPIWPSRIRHELHRLRVGTRKTLKIESLEILGSMGVDVSRYDSFDYSQTQAIAAAAHFLEFDGLMVPSARAPCRNLVLFTQRAPEIELLSSSDVDWDDWRKGVKTP